MSATSRSPANLFGIDLAAAGAALLAPWRRAAEWAVLAWLHRPAPVQISDAAGGVAVWRGDQRLAAAQAAAAQAPAFRAIALPEEMLLLRSLRLPRMNAADVEEAARLDAQSSSPFEPHDLAWGYRARAGAAGTEVSLAVASRRQVLEHLKAQGADAEAVEAWAFDPAGAPIVLSGFGERRRLQHLRSQRNAGLALLGCALALVAALAATPTLQLRLRAVQAVRAHDQLVAAAGPLLKKREELATMAAEQQALREIIAARVDPARVMDYLTRIVPDDTSVQTVQVDGRKVVLIGFTTNAAALMQKLSAEPGLTDVRAPAPATRPPGAPKESFSVEFLLALPAAPAAQTGSEPAPVAAAAPAAPNAAPAASAPPTAPPGISPGRPLMPMPAQSAGGPPAAAPPAAVPPARAAAPPSVLQAPPGSAASGPANPQAAAAARLAQERMRLLRQQAAPRDKK